MAQKKLPLIPSDDTTRVWVNEDLGSVVTDFLGSGGNLDNDDLKKGFHAYSMASVYEFEAFPDETFSMDKLEDVNDGDLDYDGDTVECRDSAMVMFHETDDYDKAEHFDNVLGLLNLPRIGWVQVAGPRFAEEK